MDDPRIDALARVLVDYSAGVEPEQLVGINGGTAASPLLLALYRLVLERGAHPLLISRPAETDEIFYRLANEAQLTYISPISEALVEQTDAQINVLAQTNTKALSNVDPSKQAKRAGAAQRLQTRFMERTAQGELDWTLTLFPTPAYAQDAEMSLAEFETFVFGAGLLNRDDPIQAWKRLSADQQRLIDWIRDKSDVHLTGPGTDLRLSIRDRVWINADGRRNFPDGEIFTAPLEDSVDGHIRFSFPAVYQGREVEGVQLTFEAGEVVDATATKNEAFLHRMLEADEGARYVGEFAIGTNPGIQRFSKNILFDEKIGGTVHLALGQGYPDTGSRNDSAIHWDMICDLREGGAIAVDGTMFAQDGRILV